MQNFLSSYHKMKQREHEFDKGVGAVVQEGILFAVPWGRVVKGKGWVYSIESKTSCKSAETCRVW